MNELMTALEAMIRRIVQEEMKELQGLGVALPTDGSILDMIQKADAAFPETMLKIVQKHCVDQGWFDNAIAAEVDNKFDSNFRGTVREVVKNMEFTIDAR